MSEFNPTPVQPEAHPYKKLGGWLWLIVASSFLSLPLQIVNLLLKIRQANNLATMLNSFAEEFGATLMSGYQPAALDFLPLASCVISVVIAVLILRRNPRFLRLYQLSFLVSICLVFVGLFADGFILDAIDELGIAVALIIIVLSILLGIGSLFLYLLYYTKSVRVRTYMGSDEYLRLAFFAKKVKGPEPAVPDAAEKTEISVEEGDL